MGSCTALRPGRSALSFTLEWRQMLSLQLDGRWGEESEGVSPGQLMEAAANHQLSTKAANPRLSARTPSPRDARRTSLQLPTLSVPSDSQLQPGRNLSCSASELRSPATQCPVSSPCARTGSRSCRRPRPSAARPGQAAGRGRGAGAFSTGRGGAWPLGAHPGNLSPLLWPPEQQQR